jgi:signal transduction histidine kinase
VDASPQGQVYEDVHRRKDGTTFPVEVSGRRFELEGKTYYHAIVRDIGERRRLEAHLAEAERTAALGALAGSLAHEINNPLAYLLADVGAAADALRAHLQTPCGAGPEGKELADAAQALAEAGDGAEHIRVIVRDLQAFARADGARGAVDLRAALRAAAALAQTGVRHRAQPTTSRWWARRCAASSRRAGRWRSRPAAPRRCAAWSRASGSTCWCAT